jgi:hypothetical protein
MTSSTQTPTGRLNMKLPLRIRTIHACAQRHDTRKGASPEALHYRGDARRLCSRVRQCEEVCYCDMWGDLVQTRRCVCRCQRTASDERVWAVPQFLIIPGISTKRKKPGTRQTGRLERYPTAYTRRRAYLLGRLDEIQAVECPFPEHIQVHVLHGRGHQVNGGVGGNPPSLNPA